MRQLTYEIAVSWGISTMTWLSILGLVWWLANVLGLS